MVLEIGANVIDLSIGDHVVLAYNYCGRCRHCERKKMYHCAELAQLNFSGTRSDGTTTISWAGKPVSSCFFGQSSFCNPAVVAAASCVKIDKSLDFAIACSLGCGIQTGSGCIFNLVKPVENEVHNLVIFGMGSVGSAAVMAANVIKKENPGVLQMIIVVDVNDDRLNMAKELGATHLLNPNTTDVREAILNLTENEGPDVSVDCTGVLSVINQMIENMAPGGKAITVGGTPHGQKASVEVHQFISKCGTYTACHQGNAVSREASDTFSIRHKIQRLIEIVYPIFGYLIYKRVVPSRSLAEKIQAGRD